MLALARTFASLRHGKVWLYVLTPALVSLLFAVGLAMGVLGWLVQQMMDYPPMTLLVGWGLVWLAHVLAYLGGWMAIFALAYLMASLLAAIVILPLMLRHLSQTEYRDVAAMGKDSFIAAALNSMGASFSSARGWSARKSTRASPSAGPSSSTTRSRSATSRRSSTSSAGRTCWWTTS